MKKVYPEQYRRGFTLIELLVVIFIISLLASIVLVSVNEARKKGRDAKRFADLRTVQTALEMYYNENKHYPITYDNQEGCSAAPPCLTWRKSSTHPGDWVPSVVGNQIPVLPLDPINRSSTNPWYSYAYTSYTGKSYKLIEYNFDTSEGQAKKLDVNDGGINDSWYEIFSADGRNCQYTLASCP